MDRRADAIPRALPLLLAALSGLAPFFIDTYLPSFREIGTSLHATPEQVQQTLTAYLVPFALMNLWHGALSDAVGRRPVVLWSLGILAASSAGCALAGDIRAFWCFRAVQGAACGAGLVVGRAVVRDVYEGPEAQRVMSHVAALFAIAPAVAPLVGGWLHEAFGWRSVFVFLSGLSLALAGWSAGAFPETVPPERRHRLHPVSLARGYADVLSHGRFAAAAAATALNFAGMFLYIASAPALLLTHLHLKETQFLWLFGPMTAGMMLGSAASGRLAGVITPWQTVAWGYGIMGVAAASGLAATLLAGPSIAWTLLPLSAYAFGMSLSMPSLTLFGLDLFPHRKGLASSCQAFVLTAGNALTAGVLSPWASHATPRLAAVQVALLAAGAMAAVVFLRLGGTGRPRTH